MSESVPASAKGVDVPERITRAIVAAKERFHAENPDRPNGFTIKRAIEAARAQWRLERPAKVNGRDPIFDAIVVACGGDLGALTPSYSVAVAQAKKGILQASPNVTPDEITRRAVRYRAKYKDAACTPRALAAHWPEFPLNGSAKKPDIYVEPVGWHDVLNRLAERSKWDRATVHLMLTSPWLEMSTLMREEILKEMQKK